MKIIFFAALWVGYSMNAMANSLEQPPGPPEKYAVGPISPLHAQTELFHAEKAAYALLTGVLHQIQAAIAARNCSSMTGIYNVSIFADGSINNPDLNFTVVDSLASSFTLKATIYPYRAYNGHRIIINQKGHGSFNEVDLADYTSDAYYDAISAILSIDSFTKAKGINNRLVYYKSSEINNFYREIDSVTDLPYIIEWGMQSISIIGYPTQKYWSRSKLLRNDSDLGKTVIVKDRLVGPTPCRIMLDLMNYNNMDFFWQSGTLTISTDPPSKLNDQFQF